MRRPSANGAARRGLTLIELLLAITLMAIIASVTYFSFSAATRAWRTGTETANSLHHADYVLEQLAMGLRSAYYPDAARPSGAYGLTLADGGDGESARDTLGWVKLGTALVGADSPIAGTPHRVEVSVLAPGASDEPGFSEGGLAISAWRIVALPEEFDPKVSVKPMLLTTRVVGFNCRVLDPENNLQEGDAPSAEDELKWDDAWEDDRTNRLPYAVELSLYLDPGREREPPIEVKRIVEIPCAPLSWRDKGAAGGRADTAVPERTAPGRTPRGRVPAQGEEREANPPREDRQPRRATR